MIKLHIQLEPVVGRKFDFIEIEVDKLEHIPAVYTKLDELKGKVAQPAKTISSTIQPNEKQLGLVKRLGGDVKKVFGSWDEFSTYIEELKAKPQDNKQAPAQQPANNDVPWDLDL